MATTKELRLIAFRVGGETFVVDIMAVRQIIPHRETRSVPTAPSFVEGIVVLRNEVVPIIDLRERLRVDGQAAKRPLILITDTSAGAIGLKVDEVETILTIASDALLPPPEVIRGVRGDLLIAIVPQGEDVYLLIDIDSVLTAEEKEKLQSVELSVEEASMGTSER